MQQNPHDQDISEYGRALDEMTDTRFRIRMTARPTTDVRDRNNHMNECLTIFKR